MTPSPNRNMNSRPQSSTPFPGVRTVLAAGLAAASLLAPSLGARAQATDPAPAAQLPVSATLSNPPAGKTRKKDEKVVQSKDTKKEIKKEKKDNPLSGLDASLPDKQLYDKALDQVKHGRYDVARLDLQTLLNTYADSEFQMRAKLAIADSWYKEGGTAALAQAEQEYKDFITFFPNAPEAAEAQLRVGDIYFKQMDKPDRDYAKAVHAEEEYRLMLQQFPESTLVPQATQRLREVQEVKATREADIASFYATHANWPATIARYQTVVDTYPLYSHMDDTLIGLGDAYEAQARYVRSLNLPEAGKARLEKIYDDQAADAYRKVVLEHSAAPHVEDARDRLAAMNLPVPTPSPEQIAASTALENSRSQYHLMDVVSLLFLHKPDTVPAATIGTPPLEDPKPTLAPAITTSLMQNFNSAMNPAHAPVPAPNSPAAPAAPTPATPAATQAPAAPLAFQDVPTAGADSSAPAVNTSVPAGRAAPAISGSAIGVEIVQPGSAPAAPAGPIAPAPSSSQTSPAAAQPEANGGLKPVGPANATPLPAIEKAGAAPDVVNDVAPGPQPPAQTKPADGKTPKPAFDKSDESSSKHKKKKGLAKLNPF